MHYALLIYGHVFEGVCTHNNSIVQLNLTRNATGHLSSPDYPFQFPPIGACYWRIKAPDGHRVKLQFTTMNISGNCEGDINDGEWVRVDDYFIGDFKSVTSFWGRFCSSASPPPIYSTRSELQVFFTSNYSINTDSEGLERFNSDQRRNHGFYATYEVIKQGKEHLGPYFQRKHSSIQLSASFQTDKLYVVENYKLGRD